jgi:hypothetical protein
VWTQTQQQPTTLPGDDIDNSGSVTASLLTLKDVPVDVGLNTVFDAGESVEA